ncbi:MAG TPA: Uma2 family endonuclease [Kofleriaceae bacterium]|jgi:Uma2 family endonuclease|nr:Uma2 family endonuclease [Kofleriaceae bacterium]
MTAEEYLAWERVQIVRHEFDHGEVFAMAGGSMRHNALCASLIEALRTQLRGRCVVFTSDQRVVAADRGRYVYPDITVVCGAVVTEPGTTDVLANPSLIIEVLSESTEKYDRDLKWKTYQDLPSLADYVLVSQAEPRIEHFRRSGPQTWTYQAAGTGARLVLTNEATLDVDAIFAGVLQLPGDAPSALPEPEPRP